MMRELALSGSKSVQYLWQSWGKERDLQPGAREAGAPHDKLTILAPHPPSFFSTLLVADFPSSFWLDNNTESNIIKRSGSGIFSFIQQNFDFWFLIWSVFRIRSPLAGRDGCLSAGHDGDARAVSVDEGEEVVTKEPDGRWDNFEKRDKTGYLGNFGIPPPHPPFWEVWHVFIVVL